MEHLIKKLSGYFGKLEQNPNFHFVTLSVKGNVSFVYSRFRSETEFYVYNYVINFS